MRKEEKKKFRVRVEEDVRRSGYEVGKVREFSDGRGVEVLWKKKRLETVRGGEERERGSGSASASTSATPVASGSGSGAEEAMVGVMENVVVQVSLSLVSFRVESRRVEFRRVVVVFGFVRARDASADSTLLRRFLKPCSSSLEYQQQSFLHTNLDQQQPSLLPLDLNLSPSWFLSSLLQL